MKRLLWTLPALLLAGCATSTPSNPSPPDENRTTPGPSRLAIDQSSGARDTLKAIPPEAALERFELLDDAGRRVAYAGLTDGAVGGVVFVENRLVGTLTRAQAQAFYSCRGNATAVRGHWATEASAWAHSLVVAAAPASKVTLEFSGKSTAQSIKSVIDNPLVGQVRALANIGTNPLSIIKTLNKARQDYKTFENDQEMLVALGSLSPGDAESTLAAALRPEDVSFNGPGVVMAYPKYSIEFYVRDAKVQLIQQPSFHQLSHDRTALFYRPGANWLACTPAGWFNAL
jgi:hypothetical protein